MHSAQCARARAYNVPVWAQAIMSRPERPIGMPHFCTGVGLVYDAMRMLLSRISSRPECSN